MRVLLFGQVLPEFIELVRRHDLTIVENDPEVVISCGGDGTLLRSEQRFPGIPKLPIKRSDTCVFCDAHRPEVLLAKLSRGQLRGERLMKLEATVGERSVTALNEIGVLHKLPYQALRFRWSCNEQKFGETIIGDGVIIATPFGSSGYFASIGGKEFAEGSGVAFSNPTIGQPPQHLSQDSVVTIEVVRGPGVLTNDNNQNMTSLSEKDTVVVKRSDQTATLLADSLHCRQCQKTR